MELIVWQQGASKIVFDTETKNFDLRTPGNVMWNGMAIGLPDAVFQGIPLQNNLVVTGDNGDGTVVPRVVQLGDRVATPTDRVVGAVPNELITVALPAGSGIVQPLALSGAFQLGTLSVAGTPQLVRLALDAVNDGTAGTTGPLAPVTVALVDTRTGLPVSTATITDLISHTGDPVLTTHEVALSLATVTAVDAPYMALRVSGGTLTDELDVTHTLVLGYPPTAHFATPATMVDALGVATAQTFDVAVSLDVITYPKTSVGELLLYGVVQDDIELLPGKQVDGVDISAFYAAYQHLTTEVVTALDAAIIAKEPVVTVGEATPPDPVEGQKWLDTSGTAPFWRVYLEDAWVAVSPSGADVDAQFRDLTARNLTVAGGVLTASLQLAAGVTIGGVDLVAMKQKVDQLTGGQYGTSLTLDTALTVGQFQGPAVYDVSSTLFVTGGTLDETAVTVGQLVAQSFTTTHTGSLMTLEVRLAPTVAGPMAVRVRMCQDANGATATPGNVSVTLGDPVQAEVIKTFSETDVAAGAQLYTITFPTPPRIAKQLSYYIEFEPQEDTAVKFWVGEGIASGRRYNGITAGGVYAEADPVTDLVLRTALFCVTSGAFQAIGASRFFGDVTIEGRLILKDTSVLEVRSLVENLVVSDDVIVLNGGVADDATPTADGAVRMTRGVATDAELAWREAQTRFEFNFPLYLPEGGEFYPVATGENHRLKMIALLAGLGFDPSTGQPPAFIDTTVVQADDTHHEALGRLDQTVTALTNALATQASLLFAS